MKVLILLSIFGVAFALDEFPPRCLFNAYYTDSGTACPLTCNNYKNPPQACPAIAVSGCQCNNGYVRLSDFDFQNPTDSLCVLPTQCPTPSFPPTPIPPSCPANGHYTNSGTACPLTCNNYKNPPDFCILIAVAGCECDPGYVRVSDFDYRNPTISACVLPSQCPAPFPPPPPEPLCPFNSKYTKSGSPCPLTCNNYKNPPQVCPTVVVPGCQCDKGYVRISDFDFNNPTTSICVLPTQCPPTFPPEPLCPFNSKYTKSGSPCPLTCNNYKNPPQVCPTVVVPGCQCDKGYVRISDFDFNNPTTSICVLPTQCPPTFPPEPLCPFNSKYTKSGSPCPLTCKNYKNPPQVCPTVVVPGCQCDKGYVRISDFDFNNPTTSICVAPSQCPP